MVDDRGYESPCWIRVGKLNNKGYGVIVMAGKRHYAHRLMYQLHVGQIAPGMHLDHLCRQKDCMNPGHLEQVTHATNIRRGVGCKLTPEQADEIRSAASHVMTKSLASRYGISESHASRVRRGLKYKTGLG